MVSENDKPCAKLIDMEKVTGKSIADINKVIVQIGRNISNDFIIAQKQISGNHAQIEYIEDRYYIKDLGSTNKTKLNGKTVTPNSLYPLRDGDELQFSVFKFIFKTEEVNQDQLKSEDEEETQKIGNYEVINLIGKGGFGSVWKAKDTEGKIVAIKILNPEKLESERAVRKFFHEAITLSKLDHPYITRFVDFFPHKGNYAIVMDFVDGTDLKTILGNRKGALPLPLARKLAEQTLDAFQYAYKRDILHRDIKPENIMVDKDGNARIMDFGIAKLSSSVTQQTSIFMVSTSYTAPERFDVKKEVDARSDIYSLGIVFYEIFAGVYPFECNTPSELIYAHHNTIPTAPEEIADIPHEMSEAILKALEKSPEDRFKDFSEFAEALLGKEIEASPDPTYPSDIVAVKDHYFKIGIAIINLFADILKKYQNKGKTFSISREGTKLKLDIDVASGKSVSIEKDMEKILQVIKEKSKR